MKPVSAPFIVVFLVAANAAGACATALRVPRNRGPRNPPRPPLHFRASDGRFRVLALTDLHYGEDPSSPAGPEHDRSSIRVTTELLRWEHPDFVIFTGDLVAGEWFQHGGNASGYIDMLMRPLAVGGYRWASTYGNHDVGENVTREELLAAEQTYELAYTQDGPAGLEGNTNYYLPVYPPPAFQGGPINTTRPAVMFWFFDSRGGHNASGEIPAYVHESVVDWFRGESRRMTAEWGPILSYAFFHYPTAEFKPISDQLDSYSQCVGQNNDETTYQEKDTGLIQALVESGVVKTSFVGHKHGNGWCCFYRTLELCFNRDSGYGGRWGGWERGGRVIELEYADPWRSNLNYVRLEMGEIVDVFPRQQSG